MSEPTTKKAKLDKTLSFEELLAIGAKYTGQDRDALARSIRGEISPFYDKLDSVSSDQKLMDEVPTIPFCPPLLHVHAHDG